MKPINVEVLESRRLLSASIINGELLATGTDLRDDIELRRVGSDDVRVTIRTGESATLASQQTFDMDDFTSIRALGLAGNDYLHVVGNVALPNLTLDGGNNPFDSDVLLARRGRFIDGEDIRDGSGRVVADFFNSPTEYFAYGTGHISVSLRNGEYNLEINSSFAGVLKRTDGLTPQGVAGGTGNDTFIIGDGIGGSVAGGAGNDFFDIARNAVNVVIYADDGDDTFFVRGGPENNALPQISQIEAGDGIDTIRMDQQTELQLFELSGEIENVTEAQGTVYGNGLDNRITVRSSNTAGVTIFGFEGNDTLIGGKGPDKLYGEDGDDTLIGNGGNDLLDGGPGIDKLDGGAGNNSLLNGKVDTDPQFFIKLRTLHVNGTAANETLGAVRVGTDDIRVNVNSVARTFDMDDFDQIEINGGAGNDTMTLGAGVAKANLGGGPGNDLLTGNELANNLNGESGDDTVLGNGGDDGLAGDTGNDTLDGGSGNDFLFGGDGDDILTGEPGDDFMRGDSGSIGNDTFFARDGERDQFVSGDAGTDRAQVDPDDVLDSIEILLP